MARRLRGSQVERHKIVTCSKTWLCALRWFDFLVLWLLIPALVFLAQFFINDMVLPDPGTEEFKQFLIITALSFLPAVLVFLWRIVVVKSHYVTFFEDCVIDRWGIITKYERRYIFLGVISTSLDQNFFQKYLLFNAKAEVHVVGKTFHFNHLGRPNYVMNRLKQYYIDDQDFHTV